MYREINLLDAVKAVLGGKDIYTIFKDDDGRVSVTPLATHTFRDLIDIKYRFIWDDEESALPESTLMMEHPLDIDEVPLKSDAPSPVPETVSENSEKPKKKKGKPGPKTQPIDVGKIRALANAGWSHEAIASEMHLSVSTVRKYLNQTEGGSEDGTV